MDVLIAAAQRGEAEEVRRVLREIVPEYQAAEGQWTVGSGQGTGDRGGCGCERAIERSAGGGVGLVFSP